MRTAEYARKGHPDRVCEIIADSLLDEFIKQDPDSRVAIEVFGAHGILTIGGELTTNAYVDIADVVRKTYQEIGYTEHIGVQINIDMQSPEIKKLADNGAGDSGIVTGYATRETKEMLPLEVVLCKKIADYYDKKNSIEIGRDGKIQITLNENKIIDTIVISLQNGLTLLSKKDIKEEVINLIGEKYIDSKTKWRIVLFDNGGFDADTGLTGRKNVIWYGPRICTGGGAFAGKDMTKIDRSGAYYSRKIAIDVLKDKKFIKECFVEMAFAIGQNTPVHAKVWGIHKNGEIIKINTFYLDKLKTSDMIGMCGNNKPIFKEASLKRHFGYKALWEK